MKKVLFIVALICLASGTFAQGTSPFDHAFTNTVVETGTTKELDVVIDRKSVYINGETQTVHFRVVAKDAAGNPVGMWDKVNNVWAPAGQQIKLVIPANTMNTYYNAAGGATWKAKMYNALINYAVDVLTP